MDKYKKFNLFLFIANLTEWHFSCRKSFNIVWKNEPQILSEREKILLKSFQKVLIKYNDKYGEHLIIEYIKKPNLKMVDLSNKLTLAERNTIDTAFNVFSMRFNYFYDKQKTNMLAVNKYLLDHLQVNNQLLEKTKILYSGNNKKDLKVIISLSVNANKAAGGMYFDTSKAGYIVMQFGDYNLDKGTVQLLNIFYHEIGHHYQNNKIWNKLTEKMKNKILVNDELSKQGVKVDDILDELINDCLWGDFGIFSKQLFGITDEMKKKKNGNY